MTWGSADSALAGALVLGALYGAVFCYREKSFAGFVIKTGATAFLSVWAWAEGGPALLVVALALSALGDAFLAKDGPNWLLPGMAAFFLAHAAYVPMFWDLALHSGWNWPVKLGQAVLVFGGAFYMRWLMPSVTRDMRWPVLVYGTLILIMGAAAISLSGVLPLVTVGALMFIASDAILAQQLFRRPAGAPAQLIPSLAVWFLYFGGQALIAWGVLSAAPGA